MFDGKLVDFTDRRSDEPLAASTLPWQLVALLLFFATLTIVAAILYPDVFGAPFAQCWRANPFVFAQGVVMTDDTNKATPGDLAAVADVRKTTEPHFEAMLGQGERATSDRLVRISQATIEERVARLEELDPAITEIVQMLRHRLDELEERVAALEGARDTWHERDEATQGRMAGTSD
jgi:hypothetical protein